VESFFCGLTVIGFGANSEHTPRRKCMKSIDCMLIKLIAWSIRPGIGLLQVHLCHRSLRRLQSLSNTPSLVFIISPPLLLSIQFFMRSTNYFKLNFIYIFLFLILNVYRLVFYFTSPWETYSRGRTNALSSSIISPC